MNAIAGNWDMTPYFDAFDGASYREFRDELGAEIRRLQDAAAALSPLAPEKHEAWIELLLRLEKASSRAGHLGGYLGCLAAADSRHDGVQAELSAAGVLRSELAKVYVVVRAAFGRAEPELFDQLVADPVLQDARHYLARLREREETSMEPELEMLAADLGNTGITAWGRLYDRLSGTLEFALDLPGQPVRYLPVSMTRTLLEDADAGVRHAALRGANAAWKRVSDTTAACLNAISGTRLTLYRRRGVEHFLDPALFDAAISRRTLDVLLEVVRSRAEVPRRYLQRKARILAGRGSGGETDDARIAFADLMAPLPLEQAGGSTERVSWAEARERIVSAFRGRYPRLADFAASAFARDWVDWEPRTGKAPGGFCSSSTWINESRIFVTFNGAPADVSTVAHELGHAFHTYVMRDQRPWARSYPMTLAETASTFAEQLVNEAVLDDPATSSAQRLGVLEARMQDAAAFMLNIPMRFDFERAVYEEREGGELSPSRFCELMAQAQRDCYGDVLDPDGLDPWFWCSKLHFYISGLSFYNFPYTFGYLFSMGIFARAKAEGEGFLPRYEALLRDTGSAPAEAVARNALGIELEEPDFWQQSIDLIAADLERFLASADELFPS